MALEICHRIHLGLEQQLVELMPALEMPVLFNNVLFFVKLYFEYFYTNTCQLISFVHLVFLLMEFVKCQTDLKKIEQDKLEKIKALSNSWLHFLITFCVL